MLLIVALCVALSVTLGQCSVAFPQNCSTEAITTAAEFLQNHARYVGTVPCFQAFAVCVNYDVMTPVQMCAAELQKPELNDPVKLIEFLAGTEDNYFEVLQAVCCVKTKESEVNKISFDYIYQSAVRCAVKNCV